MNLRIHQFIAFFLVILLLDSCMFGELKKDIKTMESVIGIGGEITNQSPHKQPLIILIYTEVDGQKHIGNFKIMGTNEEIYFFTVPYGEYYILAFEDANYNLVYDAGEYFGQVGQPDRISVTVLKPIDNLNIEVARTDGFPDGFPTDISNVKALISVRNIAAGTITNLDNKIFSEENAKMGFWQPITALYTVGAGVYFLEAYDPTKIPILFVHGASGSPRNFQFIAENIDRSRFQPWFYHYPSGFPLEKINRFLNYLITYLHDEYQFKQLYVTAHSMGGLVSRGFILKNVYEDGHDYIKLFVSISSPFGGLETAQKGVESAPAAIPSWHDLVPGSPFIEKIFSQPLKANIDYYLLFSHKGDCSFFMDNNDGAVTLRSQLDLRAQKDAKAKWGFDEGHVTILSSQDVLGIYNEILEKTGSTKQSVFDRFGLAK
jgi:pimeloyl-ACP methyl ester carboxylesterase